MMPDWTAPKFACFRAAVLHRSACAGFVNPGVYCGDQSRACGLFERRGLLFRAFAERSSALRLIRSGAAVQWSRLLQRPQREQP